MTHHDPRPRSLYEQVAATPAGARELAAARGEIRVVQLLDLAKEQSGYTNRQLAERLGVGESRVSQVLNGDGNLRVATVARFLHAMGYELELAAADTGGGAPLRTPRRRTPARHRSGARVSDVTAHTA